jgi:hypothetical protein
LKLTPDRTIKVVDLVIDADCMHSDTAAMRSNGGSSVADSQSRARVFGVLLDMPRLISVVPMLARISMCGALLLLPAGIASADDVAPLGALSNHDHAPVHVRSKPVIERLPVKVIEPVDLKLSGKGRIFIADRKAQCVFRLDEYGATSLPIQDLADIQRIQVDADESVYVLTSTGGESSLHQVTAAGQHVVLETFAFPASTFVRDPAGQFVIAQTNSRKLVSFSSDGILAHYSQLSQPAVDLAMNAGGQVEALLASGHVVLVDESGRATLSGYAPAGANRLMTLGDGSLLALSSGAGEQSQITRVSRYSLRPKQFAVEANVPAGTQAVGFDSLGNLCLANPDLRAITKVTSQFMIPCPHCGQATRMIFSTESEPVSGLTLRSF